MELSFNYQNHSEAELLWIPVIGCQAHPLNPRLSTNDEQVERIAGQIQVHGYKPEHAIIVRPVNEHYEIVSGHHRVEACKRIGLDKIIAWVHPDMSDEHAHSLLLLENDQTELSALEKGKHCYDWLAAFGKSRVGAGKGNKGGIKEYARTHGYKNDMVIHQWMGAYRVIQQNAKSFCILSSTILYEISKSPEPAWQSLCQHVRVQEIDKVWLQSTFFACKKGSGMIQFMCTAA